MNSFHNIYIVLCCSITKQISVELAEKCAKDNLKTIFNKGNVTYSPIGYFPTEGEARDFGEVVKNRLA